ncbi:MAG: DUF3565 domain-containing protein [Betaproteobacteria bacterium]|nr:MAG: DUF3565 domain-containing protein [Betaproteobacteria bacterium]
MHQAITGFHQDDAGDWVAELACGHNQHVRHNPPWTNRAWVTTAAGRQSMIGHALDCKKCDTGAAPDRE